MTYHFKSLLRGRREGKNIKKGDKEFYELMIQFEKDMPKLIYGHKIERVGKNEKVPTGIFYHDGYVNTLFHTYMHGYEYAKCLARLEGPK